MIEQTGGERRTWRSLRVKLWRGLLDRDSEGTRWISMDVGHIHIHGSMDVLACISSSGGGVGG
jgi:hypothetical protein